MFSYLHALAGVFRSYFWRFLHPMDRVCCGEMGPSYVSLTSTLGEYEYDIIFPVIGRIMAF